MLLSAKKIKSDNNTRIIWLHGWGQDHKSFLSMACLFNDCENIMIDMAGFGAAKKPKEAWGTNDYALDLAQYLKKEKISKKTYLIGHSFGCRVALRFAALFPNRVDGIVLIAAAGLKKKRSIIF